ncbi:hypothetical protein MKL29_06995 [Streptococcus suis]|nr:hypothetical protein [Streptococcus suis]
MSNHLEIVMDIDTLDIFEVIELDEQDSIETASDTKISNRFDDLDSVWSDRVYDANSSSLFWEVFEDEVTQGLVSRNKHGVYAYPKRARDGTMTV